MSVGVSGPTGFKNLRAMFENKNGEQSESPPSRGRSPNGSISSANSRPVSKVRTSFVAVERPGESGQPAQLGLRKQSDVSMAEAREEAITNHPGTPISKPVTNGAFAYATENNGLGAILKGSPFEGSPKEQPEQTLQSAENQTREPVEGKAMDKPTMNGSTKKTTSTMDKVQPKEQSPSMAASTPRQGSNPVKPRPASLNTKTATSKAKVSPTTPKRSPVQQKKSQASPTTMNSTGPAIKPRGGVSKIQGVMQSAAKAKEERAKAEQAKSEAAKEQKKAPAKDVKPPSVASKSTAASKAHAQKRESLSMEPQQPRSPTTARATKLPSAATATTAASTARKDAHTEGDDTKKFTSERRSILPQAPRVANVTTKASLAKKSSRASLANGEDRSKSRQSAAHKPADEGFLARMTRPTAASTQRAHEKVQINSPPRARQTSASYPAPKKSGRKSLNISFKAQNESNPVAVPGENGAEETLLKPVNEDTNAALLPDQDALDDGEPGPAEENVLPSQ